MIGIFFIVSLIEAVRHWYLIEQRWVVPNKPLSFVIRASAAAVILYFDTIPLWASAPAYAILDWWIHDYLLNVLREVKPIWYLNNTGFLDRLQRKYPDMFFWFVIKTLALLGLVGGYLMNFSGGSLNYQ